MIRIVLLFILFSQAQAILIDNGITGTGRFTVNVLDGGDSDQATVDPTNGTTIDLVYQLSTYVDVGINGNAFYLNGTTTVPAQLSGANQVISSGQFNGPNGVIQWTAISSIASGSNNYHVQIQLSSPAPFGNIRLINYLDADVDGSSGDILVAKNQSGFELWNLDQNLDVVLAHAANYVPYHANYIGWAATPYSDLQDNITGAGAQYSLNGEVTLSPYTDSRFPNDPTYGPDDVTEALAFDLNPLANTAQFDFYMKGLPNIPQVLPVPVPILQPFGLILLSVLIGMMGLRSKFYFNIK